MLKVTLQEDKRDGDCNMCTRPSTQVWVIRSEAENRQLEIRLCHLCAMELAEKLPNDPLTYLVDQVTTFCSDMRDHALPFMKEAISDLRDTAENIYRTLPKPYRCTWCMKDTISIPCQHCQISIGIVDPDAEHEHQWSRKTINTVECKVCGLVRPNDSC